MSKLTMREYTAAFILLTFTMSAVMTFQGGLFETYDTQLTGENKDTVKELNKNIEDAAPDQAQQINQTASVDTETDNFFLSGVTAVLSNAVNGVGQIRTLGNSLVTGLDISPVVLALLGIPVAAVVWEIISLYRGIRT